MRDWFHARLLANAWLLKGNCVTKMMQPQMIENIWGVHSHKGPCSTSAGAFQPLAGTRGLSRV